LGTDGHRAAEPVVERIACAVSIRWLSGFFFALVFFHSSGASAAARLSPVGFGSGFGPGLADFGVFPDSIVVPIFPSQAHPKPAGQRPFRG